MRVPPVDVTYHAETTGKRPRERKVRVMSVCCTFPCGPNVSQHVKHSAKHEHTCSNKKKYSANLLRKSLKTRFHLKKSEIMQGSYF